MGKTAREWAKAAADISRLSQSEVGWLPLVDAIERAISAAVAEAVAEERSACADVAKRRQADDGSEQDREARVIESAIRARTTGGK